MAALIVEAATGALGLVLAVDGILTGAVGVGIVGLVFAAIAWGMLFGQMLRGERK
ncbi:MAG TPA: hypothetical protein VFN18_13690 [Solirubrobacterales bacterium]|nr:hypothetical protein [Solirubrobacterales bacterium]